MSFKEYRMPYHGMDRAFRAVLLAPEDLFQGPEAPYCVVQLLGQFIERLDDAFAPNRAIAALHVPVLSRGQWLTVHMDLEWQAGLKDKDAYDRSDDAMVPMSQYTDGIVKITKYDGPVRWRREDWGRLTMAFSGMPPYQNEQTNTERGTAT